MSDPTDDGSEPVDAPLPPPGFAGAMGGPGGAPVPHVPVPFERSTGAPTPKRSPMGLVVLVIALLAVGAGAFWVVRSSSDDDPGRRSDPAGSTPASTSSATMAAPTTTRPTGAAEQAACETDRRTYETAVQAYLVVKGEYPPDAQALVGEFLRDLPDNAEVAPDGTVTMTGPCA